jgi:hypothetical protein
MQLPGRGRWPTVAEIQAQVAFAALARIGRAVELAIGAVAQALADSVLP